MDRAVLAAVALESVAVDQVVADRIDHFVASTRQALFVRRADNLLLIRPDKTLSINDSALEILEALYERKAPGAADVLSALASELRVDLDRLTHDTLALIDAVGKILNENYEPDGVIRMGHFDRGIVQFPTLAEIALTYGCQNRCSFCYASSPYRKDEHRLMTTVEVKKVMDRIFHQGHVPSLSFTGGEATLRKDLPELITHGQELGFRVNLITNGLRLAEREYAQILVAAGLDSAQVSLEAGQAEIHDLIVGRAGAFDQTTAGIRNLKDLGIHVHTNTTLCPDNVSFGSDLIRFIARDLGLKTMSMNMVIRTGEARREGRMEISYTEVAALLPGLLETARSEGVRLVWYSPIPYCLFNPVLHDLGAKSCACIDGILSVDPSGQVLPCSSFENGIGSLLEDDFDVIFSNTKAKYWRNKDFVPPVCRDCPDVDVCAGACPLYWDAAGSFAELPVAGSGDQAARRRWEASRRRSGSFGVEPVENN
jgi:radical SAM protein with 4Fe4S-binding SPASM domain